MQTEPDTQASPEAPVDRRRHPRYRFSVPVTIRLRTAKLHEPSL